MSIEFTVIGLTIDDTGELLVARPPLCIDFGRHGARPTGRVRVAVSAVVP